jgi:hypothetical protein
VNSSIIRVSGQHEAYKMTNLTRIALSSTAALALLAGASSLSANAAPLGTNLESLKTSAPAASENVQWRRNRAAIGVGAFGLGVVAGAAIANNRGYYYGDPYGYSYGPSYGYYEAPYGYYGHTNGNQAQSWDNPADYVR